MLIQVLQKITNSIEELGKTFDQIYKIPNSQRKKYFDQIMRLKDKLIGLKNNLKQSNLQSTQKQYKHSYLAFHRLKEQINDLLNFNKENKDHSNRSFHLKQTRKNHQDAMRLIVEKDQKIEQLNSTLFEKEELIRINFDQLRQYKKDCRVLAQQLHMAKTSLNSLQIEYSSLKAVLIRSEQSCLDYKLKDQERQRQLRSLIEQLDSVKLLLGEANKKNAYFEQLAQVSMAKCKVVQDSMKIIESEAHHLNQNYRKRQSQSLKKNKQIEELQQKINQQHQQQIEMDYRISQLNNEAEQLRHQLNIMQSMTHEQRALHYQQRNQREKQVSELEQQLQQSKKETEDLKCRLQQSQRKVQKLQKEKQQIEKESKHLKGQLDQSRQKVDQYLLMNLNLQTTSQQHIAQLNILRRQKQQYDQQLDKSLTLSKHLQEDVRTYKDKLITKEQQKARLTIELEKCQREIKAYQRDSQIQDRSLQVFEEEREQMRSEVMNLQQRLRRREKEMQILKARFVRAKIEIIHQMRQDID